MTYVSRSKGVSSRLPLALSADRMAIAGRVVDWFGIGLWPVFGPVDALCRTVKELVS